MQEITLPEKPKIIREEGNLAVFEVRACYPGYGTTIGNAIRRVLLSSLVGSAVTSFKIRGANHEFSTIPGVIEDVVEIALNLKKIRFKMFSDGPIKLTLKGNKEGEVKASEIKATSDIEVVNKDAHIATITDKNSKLEIELTVERGIGYVSVEQQGEAKAEIGNIAIDAIFTPIKKVSYKVENMRVGKMTNYDKLVLELETDGSITPEEAFKSASKLLVNHFNLFKDLKEEEEAAPVEDKGEIKKQIEKEKVEKREEKVEKEKEKQEDVLKTLVEELNLSPRVLSVLTDNKVKTVSKLIKKSEEDLKVLPGMGDKGIKEIRKSLGKLGLTLKSN